MICHRTGLDGQGLSVGALAQNPRFRSRRKSMKMRGALPRFDAAQTHVIVGTRSPECRWHALFCTFGKNAVLAITVYNCRRE